MDMIKVPFLVGQEANNVFIVTFENLNHRFFDFFRNRIWVREEAENECAMLCNHQKSGFIDFTKVAFQAGSEAENWLKVHLRALETTLPRAQQNRIMGWSRG